MRVTHFSSLLAALALASQSAYCADAENPGLPRPTATRITNIAKGIVRVQVVPEGMEFRQSVVSAVLPDLPAFSGKQPMTVTEKDGLITVSGPGGKELVSQTAVVFSTTTHKVGKTEESYPSVTVSWRSEQPDALYGLGSFGGGTLG